MILFKHLLFYLCLILLCDIICLNAENEYSVQIEGVDNPDLSRLIKSASQLFCLQDHPTKTIAALRRRVDGDSENIKSALQTQGYYSPILSFDINTNIKPIAITIAIDPGSVYTFGNIQIFPESLNIHPEMLEISKGTPALPRQIIQAEDLIFDLAARKGYPLASLKEREVIADDENKFIHVTFTIDTGPLAYFGDVSISGSQSIDESLIKNKIRWKEGDSYDPIKVEQTIHALETSRLFSSINISHHTEPGHDGRLPMTIQVEEGKHRSIGLGASYSTYRGPGLTAEWEHRNLSGKGDRFKINSNLQKETQEGAISYLVPDVGLKGQDLLWKIEGQHDITKGYEESSYSLSGNLERQFNIHTRFSYGAMYKQLKVGKSDNNGIYYLFKAPFQVKWGHVDDPLDPKEGFTLYGKSIPSLNVGDPKFAYMINTVTGTYYHPLTDDRRLILAAKGTLGSIWGPSRHAIPASERFYAGSENTLRGYRYYTVSPLEHDNKPIGGRSMMIYSLEARWRPLDKWGGTLFYDVGNVYSTPTPQFDKKLLQSVGFGLRYYTLLAPIRVDVAFPLNRRKKLDPAWQIYFSVGQSF